MIEFRVQPVVRAVALVASRRVSQCDVVRCLSLLELALMAGIAHRGHDLEFAVGGVLVAGIAVDGSVSAGQGETVIVLLNFLNRNAPSADRVALLAIRPQLAFMNVCMAVLATGPHVAEHRLHVALNTSHILVHTAQRIMGLVVIELGNSADWLPALRGVTVLARNVQIAVRATSARGALS